MTPNNSQIWPSDIVLDALRIKPDTSVVWASTEPTICGHCGKGIQAGDPFQPVRVGAFFSDTRDLAAQTAVVCGGCAVLRTKKVMLGISFTVITPEGIFPIAKDVHKAWLFLTPPEPPFVAVHSSATSQHLAWRTPVTLSKDLIRLRRGGDLFTIRPAMLHEAIEIGSRVRTKRGEENPKKVAPASPYACVDRKLRDCSHGILSPHAIKHMDASERAHYYALTPGEVWALTFLLTKNPPQPQVPEPIRIDLA